MQGIVMDIKEDRVVILKSDGSMAEITNRNYTIGQELNISSYSYKKYIMVAACLIFCFVTGISGYALCSTPYSYVYIDINPSLRLDINYFDHIISVVPLNDDAKELINTYHFKSKNTENCINEIVAACRETSYLNEDNNKVDVEVLTTKNNLTMKIDNSVKNLQKNNVDAVVQKISKEENQKAISYKTSPKRYKAIETYTNTFGGNIEENILKLRATKVKDIYAEIKNKSNKTTENVNEQNTSDTTLQSNILKNDNQYTAVDVKNSSTTTEYNSNNDKKYKNKTEPTTPTKRDKAIDEYTKIFGETADENSKLLKNKTVKEIYALIQEKSSDSKITEKENSKKKTQTDKATKSEKDSKEISEKRKNKKQKFTTSADGEKTVTTTSKINVETDTKIE